MKNLGNSWTPKKDWAHSIIYYNAKFLQEETCKQAI